MADDDNLTDDEFLTMPQLKIMTRTTMPPAPLSALGRNSDIQVRIDR